jgi:hypothetical protein
VDVETPAAAATASGEVSSPSTISTRRITEAGLKKCRPSTFSGRVVAVAISLTDSAEVLVARIAWPGVAASRAANTSSLSAVDSGTASIALSTDPRPS